MSGLQALRDFASPLIGIMKLNFRWRMLCRSPLTLLARAFEYETPSGAELLLDKYLFHGRRLSKLMSPPLFVFTATDLATGRPFYLTGAGSGVRPHFLVERSSFYSPAAILDTALYMPVARAVAISAAFPLAFNPIPITVKGKEAEEYYVHGVLRSDPGLRRRETYRLHLVDGGVSDNLGITFYTNLTTRSKLGGNVSDPEIVKAVFCYDAGKASGFKPGVKVRRLRAFREVLHCLDGAKEGLNDHLIRFLTDELGHRYGLHRAVSELASDLGIEPGVLDAALRARTDLDSFTDTEIFVLAYTGYRLAIFGFLNASVLARDAVGSDEDLLRDFSLIMHQLLKPLPREMWFEHLLGSRSSVALARVARRLYLKSARALRVRWGV